MKTRCLKFVLALCACCALLLTAVAAEMGTLNILATDPQEQPVAGFEVLLVPVAAADGVLTEAFAGAGIKPEALLDADAAAQNAEILLSFAEKNKIEGTKVLTDETGRGTFDGLDRGIYLVRAGENQELTFAPFLLFMPTALNGEDSWLLEAELKIGEKPEDPTEPEETPPQDPTPSLPQTGINKLPMYLLFVCGALFIVMGIVLMRPGKGSKANE